MYCAYVFGPVLSSRLGRSLGLDLTGARICSMDCLYCEVGLTEKLTVERAPYVPAAKILDELSAWIATHDASMLDYVTLGGSGEPTLNSELGEIIDGCKRLLPSLPVAVLTNTSTMGDPAVCAALHKADVILPSLDSLVEKEFRAINRPHASVTALGTADALLAFSQQYCGKIFLEVLLCNGINDSEENCAALMQYVRVLAPTRVDVTTLSRPGASTLAQAVDNATRENWCQRMNDSLPTPYTASAVQPRYGKTVASGARDDQALEEALLESLSRRPQTLAQMASALNIPLQEVEVTLTRLLAKGLVLLEGKDAQGSPFYALSTRKTHTTALRGDKN